MGTEGIQDKYVNPYTDLKWICLSNFAAVSFLNLEAPTPTGSNTTR